MNQRRCTHRAKVTQECIFSPEAVDIDINALNKLVNKLLVQPSNNLWAGSIPAALIRHVSMS